MGKKAVIFDLDGTLWDSSKEVVESWNIVIKKHGLYDNIITLKDMHGYMGKTLDVISKLMLPNIDEDERKNIMDECCEEEHRYLRVHGGTLYNGLIDMFEKLKNDYELYIVSNCQDGYIQLFIDYYKLDKYIDDIEMAGRTNLSKGENIRLIMDRNNIEKAIYVGDTNGDFESAKQAGVPFIHAKYGFGQVDKPDYVANNISDVVEGVKKILG